MDDYLKNLSTINATSTSLSSSTEEGNSILELPEHPPEITSSSINDKEAQAVKESPQYLTPQKVKLRKYTLKKG